MATAACHSFQNNAGHAAVSYIADLRMCPTVICGKSFCDLMFWLKKALLYLLPLLVLARHT